jgi:predicted transcriptional regulator of viral defense system
MRLSTARKELAGLPVFSLRDLRILEPGFRQQYLSLWHAGGKVTQVARGFYLFADEMVTESRLMAAANRIYCPSYISLQSALSIYGLIPETVTAITSVSTRKTRRIETPFGRLLFRTIKPAAYSGYSVSVADGFRFSIAHPEKALVDLLHLEPSIRTRADIEEMRIDAGVAAELLSRERLMGFAELFGSGMLVRRVSMLAGSVGLA